MNLYSTTQYKVHGIEKIRCAFMMLVLLLFHLTSRSARMSSSNIFKVSENVLFFLLGFFGAASSSSSSEGRLILMSLRWAGVLLPLLSLSSAGTILLVGRCFNTCNY